MGTSHVEDEPVERKLVRQIEEMHRTSLRMAERLVNESAGHMDWETREAREKYAAFIPMIAASIFNNLLGIARLTQEAEKTQQETYDSVQRVLDEAKRLNGTKPD